MQRGYRAFLDKTADVPNLMDDNSEYSDTGESATTGATSGRRGLSLPVGNGTAGGLPAGRARSGVGVRASSSSVVSGFSGSDVFEGIREEEEPAHDSSSSFGLLEKNIPKDVPRREKIRPSWNTGGVVDAQRSSSSPLADFEGGHSSYSTEFNPFASRSNSRGGSHLANNTNRRPGPSQQRRTDDVDFMEPSLDISAISNGGSANAFSHKLSMEEEGRDNMDDDDEFESVLDDDDFESLPDLSVYCIQPEAVRGMVRAFRKICTSQMEISDTSNIHSIDYESTMLYDFEELVDTKKAFALFEMRSRIMETDIDRGLERRGGTNVVDDLALTPYFRAANRVRDAVIVSKAWREGATPKDVVTAHLLTRRSARAHYVRRPIRRLVRSGGAAPFYGRTGPRYWSEEVRWMDDTDFALMRCQSLGAGAMRGFEMFTIGDCQSILLKMTSDNCMVSTEFHSIFDGARGSFVYGV